MGCARTGCAAVGRRATEWLTTGGQPAIVQRASGPAERTIILDERELYDSYHVQQSERHWQARLVADFQGGALTTTHVITVGRRSPVTTSVSGDTLVVGRTRLVFAPTGLAVDG